MFLPPSIKVIQYSCYLCIYFHLWGQRSLCLPTFTNNRFFFSYFFYLFLVCMFNLNCKIRLYLFTIVCRYNFYQNYPICCLVLWLSHFYVYKNHLKWQNAGPQGSKDSGFVDLKWGPYFWQNPHIILSWHCTFKITGMFATNLKIIICRVLGEITNVLFCFVLFNRGALSGNTKARRLGERGWDQLKSCWKESTAGAKYPGRNVLKATESASLEQRSDNVLLAFVI